MRTPPDDLTTSRETTRSSRHTQSHTDQQFNLLLVIIYLTCPVPVFSRTHEKLSSASVDPVRAREPLNRSSGSTLSLSVSSLFDLSHQSFLSRGSSLVCCSLYSILYFILFLFRRRIEFCWQFFSPPDLIIIISLPPKTPDFRSTQLSFNLTLEFRLKATIRVALNSDSGLID